MKKSVKLAGHVVNSNITYGSLPLLEKIYDGERIIAVISNIGEDVQYRTVVANECMMRKKFVAADTMLILGYNYCM
jgi:hypothetical protein